MVVVNATLVLAASCQIGFTVSFPRLLADCFGDWQQVKRRPQFAAAGSINFNGSLLKPGADAAHTGVQQG